jgi:hypothetical protein
MFALYETNPLGELFGIHADILDYNGNNPSAPDYRFVYDPMTDKDYFDATHAYYSLNTTWNWWNTNVVNKYVHDETYPDFPHYVPYFSDNYPIPTIVNLDDCNAYYSSAYDFYGDGILLPGFLFGNDNACAPGSEDLAIDEDVVRHEFTHAMMHWAGFEEQFGGAPDGYGRSMGEGNADFFAFLKNPRDPRMADVAWAWSPEGYLRNLNNTRRYPDDVPDPGLGAPEEHYTGEIWGGYLYDLYRLLGANALKYVFQSFYYFDGSGGQVSGEADFFDGVNAQYLADFDVSDGRVSSTMKAYGSMVSRGFSNALRPVYGTDNHWGISWVFPPTPSIVTTANFLHDGDEHEYGIVTDKPGMDLSVTVTAMRGGLINPTISLYSPEYDSSGISTGVGHLWTTVGPTTTTSAQLKWWNLIPGQHYVIIVRGTATNPGASRYYFRATVR